MTEKEKMLSGGLYIANDPELKREFKMSKEFVRKYNITTEEEPELRSELIKGIFKSVGKNCYIEPPFHCDYGCRISVGDNFYANYDAIIIDVNEVIIGDNVMFGPRVSIYTAGHPIDADIRNELLEYGKKVEIGSNVWVGGNTVFNPGVKVGNNVVIGSGSVITKDIPSNVVAVGNPCRVLREITDKDREYWQKQKDEYYKK